MEPQRNALACLEALEPQQHYFSHSAILVAIVSIHVFRAVLMWYRTIIARHTFKMGSPTDVPE